MITSLGIYEVEKDFAVDSMISEWRTTTASESITLPLRDGYTYNFDIDWGDGSAIQTVTSWNHANATHTYATAGDYIVLLHGGGTCETWWVNGVAADKDKLIAIHQMGKMRWRTFHNSFWGCSNLAIFVLGTHTLNGLVTFNSMFQDCTSMDGPNFDFSGFLAVDSDDFTEFWRMFQGCTGMITPPVFDAWNTGNLVNVGHLFDGCSNMTTTLDVTGWDTTRLINTVGMFEKCSSLTVAPDTSGWGIPDLGNTGNMYFGCTNMTGFQEMHWTPVNSWTTAYGMYEGTAITTAEYDQMLINWEARTNFLSTMNFDAGTVKYSAGAAATARNVLDTTWGWTITDGGQA